MTDLIETSQWEAGIRQIETNDPVLGGPPVLSPLSGVPNIASQQLANRTLFLKTAIEELFGEWNSTSHPDIATLLSGTNRGRLLEGDEDEHVVIGIQSDDVNDGFHIVAKGTNPTGTYTEVLASITAGTAEFLGDLITKGGSVEIQAPAGENALLWLRDENGDNEGLLFWNQAVDRIVIRRYDATGTSAEGEISIGATDFTFNGDKVWHDGDAPASMASAGYQQLPSGLLVQWGADSVANDDLVTFPIAFPNACWTVQATDNNATATAVNLQHVGVHTLTTTGFNASVFLNDGVTAAVGTNLVHWLAIGN